MTNTLEGYIVKVIDGFGNEEDAKNFAIYFDEKDAKDQIDIWVHCLEKHGNDLSNISKKYGLDFWNGYVKEEINENGRIGMKMYDLDICNDPIWMAWYEKYIIY